MVPAAEEDELKIFADSIAFVVRRTKDAYLRSPQPVQLGESELIGAFEIEALRRELEAIAENGIA